MKQIQKTLMEISMDLKNAPLLARAQRNTGEASRPGDPSAFFRPERDDIYYPPSLTRDPDVWDPPPPIEHKTRNTRISTANRKSEVNRKNAATKSAGNAPPGIKGRLGGGRQLNGKGGASSARASSSKNGNSANKDQENRNGDNKGGEKSDKDKEDDEDQQSEAPEKKFEPASHSDVDLVDMLGEYCKFYFIT